MSEMTIKEFMYLAKPDPANLGHVKKQQCALYSFPKSDGSTVSIYDAATVGVNHPDVKYTIVVLPKNRLPIEYTLIWDKINQRHGLSLSSVDEYIQLTKPVIVNWFNTFDPVLIGACAWTASTVRLV